MAVTVPQPGLRGLFVTGTDTGVGKTFVTAAVARNLTAEGYTVGVLKPVATGSGTSSEDADALITALGREVPGERVAPLLFEEPLAPSVAARRAGQPLTFERVLRTTREALSWWLEQGVDLVLVEGVGGLLCPLAERATVADLAVALDFPLVIVARRGLGTLNHTLLTVEVARGLGLRIAGIVLNGAEPTREPRAESTNSRELVRYLENLPLLQEIPFDPNLTQLDEDMRIVNWFSRGMASRLFGLSDSNTGSRG